LVGNVQTFLPASSTRLSLKFEELGGDKQLGDAFGENIEDQLSPLVLVVGKDGALVSDRVFTGVATRAIQNVVALDSFRFVAAGLTFGERGWMMSFALQKPKGDVGSRIGTWLNGIWASFGGSHLRER
jgi:hypothetical protein